MSSYILMALSVFSINVIPGFMPPTWAVLAFFYITYQQELIPTVIIGALSAVSGRIVLAKLSQRYIRPILPKKIQVNLEALGTFLHRHDKFSIPLIILYAFLPIPSNHVFIAVGLSGFHIQLIAFSFFIGRLISYTFWVSVAKKIVVSQDALWLELAGFAALILISLIPWEKLLKKARKK